MEKATVIEINQNDSIVITKNGQVIGFVEVERKYGDSVKLVAHPVESYEFGRDRKENVFNSFATTMATNFPDIEDILSAENFIKAMKREAK
jgi:hypothetical protein